MEEQEAKKSLEEMIKDSPTLRENVVLGELVGRMVEYMTKEEKERVREVFENEDREMRKIDEKFGRRIDDLINKYKYELKKPRSHLDLARKLKEEKQKESEMRKVEGDLRDLS